jgi:hypothetical protein
MRASRASQASRAAPSASATETPIGTVKQGKNGAYWVVLPTKKSSRWVEISPEKPAVYNTETNGSSLHVILGKSRAYVFYQEIIGTTSSYKYLYTSPVYDRVWSSKGTWLVPPRRKSGAAAPKAPKHTTLLLKIGRLTYLHIDGHAVVRFSTTEPIIDYDAPMGNSFLPYAFAQTATEVYLMLEGKRIPLTPDSQANPYDVYYSQPTNSKTFTKTPLIDTWTSPLRNVLAF